MAKLCDADTVMAAQVYSELSFRKKFVHFWIYHWKMVLTVIFFLSVGWMAYVLRPIPTPDANLRIMFVNAYIPMLEEENNTLIADYESYLGEGNSCEMELSYCVISPEDKMREDTNMDKVTSAVTKWSIELFVMDGYSMAKVCPTGFIKDLNTCVDSDVLSQVQERLVYHNDLEGNPVPMAIDITDTEYAEKIGIRGDGVFVAFAMNSPNEEVAKAFVTYILSAENR